MAWQDIPPRPERERVTPEERKLAEGNPHIIAKIADQTAGPQWDLAGAIPIYKKALQHDPDNVRANLGIAIVYAYRNSADPKTAIPHFEKVVRHAKRGTPEHAHAEGMLKYLKQEQDRKPNQ